MTEPDYDKELELELNKGNIYWENDTKRRPDSQGYRKDKPRLRYNWREISKVIRLILKKHKSEGIELTLRKLNYLLIALRVIPGLKKTYGSLDDHMTTGRETGQYEPDCLVDDRHPIIEIEDDYNTPDGFIEYHLDRLRSISAWYHEDDNYFPRWWGQKNYVEIWTEKEAAVRRLRYIKDKNNLQVRIVPFGGFPSFASLHDSVENRLKKKMDLGQNIHIIYLGDFDPSGEKIDETTKKRLMIIWHVATYAQENNVKFFFHRIAVTKQQIIDYNLPWDPEKTNEEEQLKLFKNPNYRSMVQRHGQAYNCGLDAFEILNLNEYESTVVNSVNRYFDYEVYKEGLKSHKEKFPKEYINQTRDDHVKKFAKELED